MSEGQKVHDSVWDGPTTTTEGNLFEVRNNHELSDDSVLFSVAGDGWFIIGQPPLRQLLRYWWRQR